MLQLLKCSTQYNGANYRINLNRESKIFYESFTLTDDQEVFLVFIYFFKMQILG